MTGEKRERGREREGDGGKRRWSPPNLKTTNFAHGNGRSAVAKIFLLRSSETNSQREVPLF